jgi:S-DNA-T family DNA segregation ATPase FtsK/SpoIIIE
VTTRNADGTDFDEPFEPFELSTAGPEDVLVVRPFVYGRALTTLERRLERSGSLESSPFGPEIDELVDRIAGGAGSDGIRSIPRSLVPDPLPDIVDMARLLATNEADAVPIGLADDPERGHHDIVWWQPGTRGSMLFVGGPRSGMDAAIGSLPVGIAERYAPSDVHLHSIDSSNRRLLPVQQLAHTRAAVSPDRLDHAAAIIDLIALEVAARRAPDVQNDPDGAVRPSLLLLIGDLTQLGRRLRDRTYDNTLDNLRLIAAAGDVGVNVVATVARASDACGLIDLVDSLFVASPGAAVRSDA